MLLRKLLAQTLSFIVNIFRANLAIGGVPWMHRIPLMDARRIAIEMPTGNSTISPPYTNRKAALKKVMQIDASTHICSRSLDGKVFINS